VTKPRGRFFTLSAAETLILILLLIVLIGAITVRVFQRGLPDEPATVTASKELRHRINLNETSEGELTLVPGIGSARTERIAKYRRRHNGFSSVNDFFYFLFFI
jgi:DNA uptake protein ComE-like DNA-binding protein